MSLINLTEDFLYQRLPQGLIELDERYLIQSVLGGYQDRIEDLRAYAKKFQLFFSPIGLPETGPNVVMVDMTGPGGKSFTRSLDITSDTPTSLDDLGAWAAAQLGVPVDAVSNARYAVDSLRQVDASILDYLATNIGAVLYKSSVAENQPDTITQTGTYTATDVAHQKLIETYFPRLKFKGTARSFEALGKLLGFDDVRVTPLWGRVSPRLPSDPGSPVNDSDFSQVPEYWPRQFTGPAYDPLNQNDGPFYSWFGTASNGTGQTNFYTQLVNGFQPWVRVDVLGVDFGTVTHPSSGTYVLAGGAPHQKAFVAAGTDLQFTALGEGDSWNGIVVGVTDLGGTLARLDITDRLSSIKYRTSYYDLAITMDEAKADATFGTLTAKTNKDIAPLPGQTSAQGYVSFGGTLFGTSPFRPFTGGTATFQNTTGIQTSDFLTPFAGTVLSYTERREATLGIYQENYDDLAKAGQGVSQALEEVRPATRSPRRSNYGYLIRDQISYAPIQADECVAVVSSTGSQSHQFTGTFTNPPLPPYAAQAFFEGTEVVYPLSAETIDSDPKSVYFKLTYPGTITGHVVLAGTGTNSYDFVTSGVFAETGTLCVGFYGTIGQDNAPDSHEVVRPGDAYAGTQVFAALADYALASNYPGPAQDVADLIHSWKPEAILAVGDNNYPDGDPSTIYGANVGYLADILAGKMFPALGNHDLDTDGNGSTQINFFFDGTAPGNGRYYNVRRGNTEFFCLNPGWTSAQANSAQGNASYNPTTEPDGNTFTSIQGQWLKAALARSTALWKVVYFHFPPYVSSTATDDHSPGHPRMRWPFREWGATIVLNGHSHSYERLLVDNFPYIVNGIGGQTNRVYNNAYISPGSQFRYAVTPGSTDYGALKITATESFIRFDMILRTGALIDSYQINRPDKRYMERPEDELDDDLVFETADEYPYRRDIIAGGELIETDYYATSGTNVEEYSILEQTTAVKDQTGADYNVYLINSASPTGHRFTTQPRSVTPFQPGQRAIAFSGQFRNQASLGPDDLDLFVSEGGRTKYFRSELDTVFQPGYRLYHAGLVDGVLVADPESFNRSHHSESLAGWLPFNEHPDDDLIVADVAMNTARQVVANLTPSDRLFDTQLGRYLQLRPGCFVMSGAARDCYDDFTISFWAKTDGFSFIDVDPIVTFGGVSLVLDASAGQLHVYASTNGVLADTIMSTVVNTTWRFICLSKTASRINLYSASFGDTSVSPNYVTGTFDANSGEDALTVSGASRKTIFIRDLRIWNTTKTETQVNSIYDYKPRQTVVPYRIGHVLTLNDGDRYGLQVLANGWIAPAKMPAWVRTPKFARVVRYDGRGEYKGEDWRKEVGLGGGQIPPTTYQLGNQFFNLTAAGTTVAAPTLGVMPGSNDYWRKDATGAPGKYIVLSGSTSQGTTATVATTGTTVPWPNYMLATNPNQDQVWLKDDSGHVYLCKLEATSGTTAKFTAQPGTLSNQEQADTIAFLAGTGYTLGVTGYGSVVQKSYSGTDHTPPLYMYLHDVLLEDVGGAQTFARWVDPTAFGAQQGFPALKENGELSLTNTATLFPGTYKLVLDVGNIGKVDQEFDGYRVDLTIGDLTLNETLLPGVKGTNFRAQQEIEFDLDHTVSGDWLLTLAWLNAFTDVARGTTRQLILYGYKLRRLETNLFRVDIAASGTDPVLTRYPDLKTLDWTHVPGGWLLEFSSYGTVKATAHEGTVYPENDTTKSKYPLANLLTGNTAYRREDVLISTGTGNFVLPDIADPTISSFGTGIGIA